MSILKKYNYKKILLGIMWLAIGSGCVVLLAAAMHKKDAKLCKGIEIEISGVNNNFFIDQQDIKKVVQKYAGNDITGRPVEAFDLVSMEKALKNEIWISKAELYFDNNDILQAEIHEREPVARVFTSVGNSFYIDNTSMMLPLSDKLSARLPVFTNFPSDTKVLSKPDSALLNDIRDLSLFIQKDSFLMAMIDQVDITAQRQFEMVPKIGDQLIVFGDAKDAEQKFNKLRLFYKKVIPMYGWGKYSVISLQYKGQIVAKIKGADDVSADSLRTIQIMQAIAAYTSRMASDSTQTIVPDNVKNSTDVSLILQSLQRDDEGEQQDINSLPAAEDKAPAVIPVPKPVMKTVSQPAVKTVKPVAKPNIPVKKITTKPVKPVTQKPVKPAAAKPAPAKPKVVMPSKNEY